MVYTIEETKRIWLSDNFTLHELLRSDTAVRDGLMFEQLDVSEVILENLKSLVRNVLQPLRDTIRAPVTINSGYRCYALNRAVGGSTRSDHVRGMAADITTPQNHAAWVYLKSLKFKQLIKYGDIRFIHVSFDPKDNGNQVLSFP